MFSSIGNLFKSKKKTESKPKEEEQVSNFSEQDTYDKTNTNSAIILPEDMDSQEVVLYDENMFQKFYEEKLKNWW
jgi:hypothetical protein